MVHIRKIKTWNGLRYAVVSPFTYPVRNSEGKLVNKTETFPVEYVVDKKTHLAIFPLTDEGLSRAKEVQSLLK